MFFAIFGFFLKIYQNMGQKLGSNSVDALGQVSIVSHSYQTYFGFPGSDLNLDCGLCDYVITRFASCCLSGWMVPSIMAVLLHYPLNNYFSKEAMLHYFRFLKEFINSSFANAHFKLPSS